VDGPDRGRRRRWLIFALVMLGVVLLLGGTKFVQIRKLIATARSQVPPPVSVATSVVREVEWQPTLDAVGTLTAVRGALLGTEVTGTVRSIEFENGATVDEGQVLVRLDTSAEEARLQSAIAQEVLNRQTLGRTRLLQRQGVASKAQLETAQAAEKQSRADIANLRATIAKKVIRAPFAGRVGIRRVELGQVVNPGTPIVSLQTVAPIFVDVWLPEQALAQLEQGDEVRMTIEVFPGASWTGKITTISPEVDPVTRNVRIRATLPNDDGRLEPGMFGDVSVKSGPARLVLMIPVTSVVYSTRGDSVYLVRSPGSGARAGQARGGPARPRAPAAPAELVAHQRLVRLGAHQGDFVVVTSGVSRGEVVVSSGAFKLKEGDRVVVHDELAPKPSLNPKPGPG